jgi:hypothetical protein
MHGKGWVVEAEQFHPCGDCFDAAREVAAPVGWFRWVGVRVLRRDIDLEHAVQYLRFHWVPFI